MFAVKKKHFFSIELLNGGVPADLSARVEVLLDGVQGHVQHGALLGRQVLLRLLGHVLAGRASSVRHYITLATVYANYLPHTL